MRYTDRKTQRKSEENRRDTRHEIHCRKTEKERKQKRHAP